MHFVVFRRMRGGRRLWESKDDRKWGHDKFEEIASQEKHYKEVIICYKYFLYLKKEKSKLSNWSLKLRASIKIVLAFKKLLF